MRYELSGQLKMKDDEYEYVLQDTNVSQLLDSIYINNENPVVAFKIEAKGRQIFNEEGYLKFKKDTKNVECYHINGVTFDNFLWEHTGDFMNITVNTFNSKVFIS